MDEASKRFWDYVSRSDERVARWSEPQRSAFQTAVDQWPNRDEFLRLRTEEVARLKRERCPL